MPFYVYILANRPRGTFYVGVTNDLVRRVFERKSGFVEGFTKRYGIKTLVYVEPYDRIADAIRREKRLKRWNRTWKIELVERDNPDWSDLYEHL